MNHIESVILNSHKTQKSCYYDGDLEGNDIIRLMSKEIIISEETRMNLYIHRPINSNVE